MSLVGRGGRGVRGGSGSVGIISGILVVFFVVVVDPWGMYQEVRQRIKEREGVDDFPATTRRVFLSRLDKGRYSFGYTRYDSIRVLGVLECGGWLYR